MSRPTQSESGNTAGDSRATDRIQTRNGLRMLDDAVPPVSQQEASVPTQLRTRALQEVSAAVPPAANIAPAWASRYRTRLVVSDLAVIFASVAAAFFTRFLWNQDPAQFVDVAADYVRIIVVIIISWATMLAVMHTRHPRIVGIGIAEYRSVVNASFLSFGLLGIVFLILEVKVARGFFILALPIGVVGLLVSRWLWRQWLMRRRREGHFVARAIVVGALVDVEYVIRQIDKKNLSIYQVIGVATDIEHRRALTINSRSVPIVSDLENVARSAAEHRVDAVIIAGQAGFGDHYIRDLGWDLEGTTAELVVASRLTNVAGPRIHFRPVEGLPLMHVELPSYEGGKHVLKRALDVAASAIALLLLAPFLLVIALVVYRDSPGPVIFRQERVGRAGKTFSMLKFRSMVATAESDLETLLDQNEGAGALFKMRADPRVTRVGRVLRKYSLDELPQLMNILRGEMSLVGPRPPLPSEVETYGDRVHRRLYIKPGLTGMWQVNGRSNLDWDESVRLDLYYVENWSIVGDLVIIWRTFKVLVNPVGAY